MWTPLCIALCALPILSFRSFVTIDPPHPEAIPIGAFSSSSTIDSCNIQGVVKKNDADTVVIAWMTPDSMTIYTPDVESIHYIDSCSSSSPPSTAHMESILADRIVQKGLTLGYAAGPVLFECWELDWDAPVGWGVRCDKAP